MIDLDIANPYAPKSFGGVKLVKVLNRILSTIY